MVSSNETVYICRGLGMRLCMCRESGNETVYMCRGSGNETVHV